MDQRLTALETKWDAVIPTLATKADLEKSQMAMKADLERTQMAMKADLEKFQLATKADFDQLRVATTNDLKELRQERRAQDAELRGELHKMNLDQRTWAVATLLAMMTFQGGMLVWLSRVVPPAPNPSITTSVGPSLSAQPTPTVFRDAWTLPRRFGYPSRGT